MTAGIIELVRKLSRPARRTVPRARAARSTVSSATRRESRRGGGRAVAKEARETRDLSDGLREKFSNCQRTTTLETDKFSSGFRRLRYIRPPLVLRSPPLGQFQVVGGVPKARKDSRPSSRLFSRRFSGSFFSSRAAAVCLVESSRRLPPSCKARRQCNVNKSRLFSRGAR